jgi:hypothetical protein
MKMILSYIAGPLILVSLIVLLGAFFISKKPFQIKKWNRAVATVKKCEVIKGVEKTSGTDSPSAFWTISIAYQFNVDGVSYSGNKYSNVRPSSRAIRESGGPGPSQALMDICQRHKSGTTRKIYYDPNEPEKSYFAPDFNAGWWIWLLGLFMFVLGGIGKFIK